MKPRSLVDMMMCFYFTKNKMKKIIVAYHVYLIGHCVDMITDQIENVIGSGLLNACDRLYIGAVDPKTEESAKHLEWLRWFCSRLGSAMDTKKITLEVYDDNMEEARTLKFIRDYSAENPGDYACYFHTKGITQFSAPTESWRRYMEYFTVEKWRNSVKILYRGFDCCGVMFNKDTPLGYWPHFSGNFWWAKTEYINTLDHTYLDHPWRYMREFWIGSNPQAKAFEIHNSGYNTTERLESGRGHYSLVYPSYKYRKK